MQATKTQTTEERLQLPSRAEREQQFDHALSQRFSSFRRIAFRKLNNAADAEDAVQDALLAAYTHLEQFNGEARMSTWLTTIVINCARMQLRGRSKRIHLSLDQPFGDVEEYSIAEGLADSLPNPEEESRNSEMQDHILRLMKQLSPPLRRAFHLRDLQGLTTREAALILGVPAGTVKARLARARSQLRKLMLRTLNGKSGSHVNGSSSLGTKPRLMAA